MENELVKFARTVADSLRGNTEMQYHNIKLVWEQGRFKEIKDRPVFTPNWVIEKQLNAIGKIAGLRILTPNIEYVPSLVNAGSRSVTLMTKENCDVTKNLVTSPTFGLNATYQFNPNLEPRMNNQYDIVIGNPPYRGQAKLHQKFFNLAVNLVKPDGTVSFIQPATAYFNKKSKTDPPSEKMRNNIKKYQTEVIILPPSTFDNVSIRGDLAITKLVKTETNSKIKQVTYASGKVIKNVDLENVTKTELDPSTFASINRKYKACVKKFGSIMELQTLDKKALKARLPARMTEDEKSWPIFFIKGTCSTSGAHGILASSEDEVRLIYEYLKTNPARFGLALLMFSTDLKGGGHSGLCLGLTLTVYGLMMKSTT